VHRMANSRIYEGKPEQLFDLPTQVLPILNWTFFFSAHSRHAVSDERLSELVQRVEHPLWERLRSSATLSVALRELSLVGERRREIEEEVFSSIVAILNLCFLPFTQETECPFRSRELNWFPSFGYFACKIDQYKNLGIARPMCESFSAFDKFFSLLGVSSLQMIAQLNRRHKVSDKKVYCLFDRSSQMTNDLSRGHVFCCQCMSIEVNASFSFQKSLRLPKGQIVPCSSIRDIYEMTA
jgi:hypothetical protein